MAPTLVPAKVRVRAPLWLLKPMRSVLVKLKVLFGPAAEESSVPPLVPTPKRRLVVAAVLLLYCRVPPLRIKSAAEPATEPLPMLLAVLTAAKVPTFRMPCEIVVGPV